MDQTNSVLTPRARLGVIVELVAIIAVFFLVRDWAKSAEMIGAGSLGILAAVVVGTLSMKVRGRNWSDLGFRIPRTPLEWFTTIAIMVLSMAVVFVTFQFVLTPILASLLEGGTADTGSSHFDFFLNRPLVFAAYMIGVVWVGAAFGEEMFSRGMMMNNVAELFGHTKVGWIVALLAQATFFGAAHAYQGLSGIIITGTIGFIFGVVYLLGKRNLLALILAHGLIDTISLTQFYLAGSAG